MNKKLGALLLLLFHAVSAVAQVPYIETLEVRVHSIDVVVTDAKGRPVTGLGPDDFQLLEDGIEQPISNFSAVAPSGAETRDAQVHLLHRRDGAPGSDAQEARGAAREAHRHRHAAGR